MTLGRPAEWSQERCTELKRMFDLDYSMALMAQKLGGLTRNAVIGKCHRLGLRRLPVDSNKPRQKYYRPAAKLTPKPRPSRQYVTRPKRPKPPVEIFPVVDSDIPLEQRKTLMELGKHDCKWPIGEVGQPGFFFCGGPKLKGLPYCLGHCRVAYNVPEPRPAKVMGVAA